MSKNFFQTVRKKHQSANASVICSQDRIAIIVTSAISFAVLFVLCFVPELAFADGLEGEVEKVGGVIAKVKKHAIPGAAIFGSIVGIFKGNWALVASIIGSCLLLSLALAWIDAGMTFGIGG